MRISEQNQKLIKMIKRRPRCEECGKRFKSLEELGEHKKDCYSRMYKCEQCDNWYENREDLEDHRSRRHSKEYGNTINMEDLIMFVRQRSKEIEDRECDCCDEIFTNTSELEEHYKIEHEIRMYKCIYPECKEKISNLYDRYDFEVHMRWKHDRDCYMCEQCSNWYENENELEKHMKEEHGIGFNCKHCDKYCQYEQVLKAHMTLHIEECVEYYIEYNIDEAIEHEDNDQCDQCGKNFGSKTNLEEHKKREHEITNEEGSKVEEKSSEIREVENRVENDETINNNENIEITSEEDSKEEENKRDREQGRK